MFMSQGIRTLRFTSKSLYYTGNSNKFLAGQFSIISRRLFFSGSSNGFSNSNSNNGHSYDASSAAGPQFSYKSAVAYQPKDREDIIYQKLKDSIMSPTGEDNYFIQANSLNDLYAGVADGVGGWAEHGFDSSAISRELCKTIAEISSTINPEKAGLTPKDIIEVAYKKIKNEEIVKVGGTTAIVAHFSNNGTLKLANLGDSWCGVFREQKLVFQTKFQTVGFNAPYQLAIIPDEMLKEAAKKGGSYIQNKPADADEYSFQLAKDDIVILATDGVTDNIATGDMELFLQGKQPELKNNLQSVSELFVKDVVALSKDPNYPSVFAQELSKLYGKQYRGGKEDDITVVVVKVE